jgi:hypothetical protein
MPGERPQPARPQPARPQATSLPERPRRWYQPPWQLVSAAIALGMGVGTIGAIALQDPLVTRYVVVDVRPVAPPGATSPPPPPTGPDGTPTGTSEARVAPGRAAASVREAWLRARRPQGDETATPSPTTLEPARPPATPSPGERENAAPPAGPTPRATPGPTTPPTTAALLTPPGPAAPPAYHPAD